MFSWQVRQSLETVLSSWPRETTHGFLQHFTTRFSFIHSGLTAYRQDFCSSLFQANECGQRVLNHRLYNFGWFNTQSKFNILTSAFKIESLFLRHLEPCLPETTLEARCALERRPNWTRSVREMKCVLVVNV